MTWATEKLFWQPSRHVIFDVTLQYVNVDNDDIHRVAEMLSRLWTYVPRQDSRACFMCPELESAPPESTVNTVRKHPGLGAYFLRDEPGNQDLPSLAEWARRIEWHRTTSLNLWNPAHTHAGQCDHSEGGKVRKIA